MRLMWCSHSWRAVCTFQISCRLEGRWVSKKHTQNHLRRYSSINRDPEREDLLWCSRICEVFQEPRSLTGITKNGTFPAIRNILTCNGGPGVVIIFPPRRQLHHLTHTNWKFFFCFSSSNWITLGFYLWGKKDTDAIGTSKTRTSNSLFPKEWINAALTFKLKTERFCCSLGLCVCVCPGGGGITIKTSHMETASAYSFHRYFSSNKVLFHRITPVVHHPAHKI